MAQSVSIALLTAAGRTPPAEDLQLRAALERCGAEVTCPAWDDVTADLEQRDLAVLRSCWDYHLRGAEFLAWIDGCAARGVALCNPPALVRANVHKGYLLALEAAGIDIPDTVLLRAGEEADLGALFAALRWREAVVKPAISASAWRTWRVAPGAPGALDLPASQLRLARLLAVGDALVQSFRPEVMDRGELSLVYLAGCFSHAVRKLPQAGEYRSQPEFGGSILPAVLGRAALSTAERVLGLLPQTPAYARVDLVETRGRPLLMELELIEPALFLEHGEGAVERFATLLLRLALERHSPRLDAASCSN